MTNFETWNLVSRSTLRREDMNVSNDKMNQCKEPVKEEKIKVKRISRTKGRRKIYISHQIPFVDQKF